MGMGFVCFRNEDRIFLARLPASGDKCTVWVLLSLLTPGLLAADQE